MLPSFKGIYRNGQIEFIEPPVTINGEMQVIVTFLEPHGIDLLTRGIDRKQAADLRARLATFAEDWDSPEMDIYDNYDEARAEL